MAEGPAPVCFTCGLPTGEVPQFNRLPNGQVCPACRDRLLDAIPPALPSLYRLQVPELGAGTAELEESHHQADWDGQPRPWPPHGLSN